MAIPRRRDDIHINFVKLEKKVEPTVDILCYQNKKQNSSVKNGANSEGACGKNGASVKKSQQKRPSSSPGGLSRMSNTPRRTRVRQQHRLSKQNRGGSRFADEALKFILYIPRCFRAFFSRVWCRARAFFTLPQHDSSSATQRGHHAKSRVSKFFNYFSYQSHSSCSPSSAGDGSALQDDVKKIAAKCKSSQQAAKVCKKNNSAQNVAAVCSNKKVCSTLKTENVQNNKKVKGK